MAYNSQRRSQLGAGLKAARRRAGLSASDASAALTAKGLKCRRGTLLAWERGVGPTSREPFSSDLRLIASLYGCDVQDFFNDAAPSIETTNGDTHHIRGRNEPTNGELLKLAHTR
jgi:transcriptional regulator with XRE-family HTH domain